MHIQALTDVHTYTTPRPGLHTYSLPGCIACVVHNYVHPYLYTTSLRAIPLYYVRLVISFLEAVSACAPDPLLLP